jgi:citronellyl-CoA dehydrogenase
MRRIVDEDINPFVTEWERAGIFPAHELFKKLGDAGLLGITRPAAFGGLDLDFSYTAAVVEALGHARCGAVPMAIGVHTDMATPALAKYGTDELRQDYLAPAISGDFVSCLGVSEPEAGSDVAALRTNARKDGGDFVINGEKMWITNSLQADWMCMLANTGEPVNGNKHHNKSLIMVRLRENGKLVPGITVNKIRKIGMNSSDTGHLFFDNVRVPQRNRIGEEGKGFIYQMQQFQEERLFAAASNSGGLRKLIDLTIEYAQQREMFGQRLADMQWFQFKMGELATEVECLRALLYRATEMYVAGQDVHELATMCKLKSGRMSRQVSDTCLQFWGGMGFTWENRISRFYRDGRLGSIGGGADEVMLGILAKLMGIAKARRD